jgi:hypothetical protein
MKACLVLVLYKQLQTLREFSVLTFCCLLLLSAIDPERPSSPNFKYDFFFGCMQTRGQKQVAADNRNPFLQANVLDLVLSYLAGEVFALTINHSCSAAFRRLIDEQPASVGGQHVHTLSCTSRQALFASAGRLRLAHDFGFRLPLATEDDERLYRFIGRYADIETLQAARKLHLPWTESIMYGAAESDVAKLKWLRFKQRVPLPYDITSTAAAAGKIEIVRWLKQRGFSLTVRTSFAAASTANNLQMLESLHSNQCPWDDTTAGAAGAADDLEQLQWLLEHGAPLTSASANEAAKGGAVRVLAFLQDRGVVFNQITMANAAGGGHLQLCQWLRVQQCPWDTAVCTSAAAGAHLSTLGWLHASGCPWSSSACSAAANRSHLDTVRWLREHGCPWNIVHMRRSAVYGSGDSTALLQYLW